MDIHEAQNLLETSTKLIKYAEDYKEARELAAKAKHSLEMILVAHLPEIRDKKSNVGYDMAILMLLEDGFLSTEEQQAASSFYKDVMKYTARYKGLERVIDINRIPISFAQSIMRYEGNQT